MVFTPKKSNPDHLIVILCGGTGPRLWPLSKVSQPKQFIPILSPDSLLIQTIKRALRIAPPQSIFLVTNQKYGQSIKKHTGPIPYKNIIQEPFKKNTLMAMLFASVKLEKTHPEAIISFFPSDHYIKKLDLFSRQIKQSYRLARDSQNIVIFGIKPTSANSSYGHALTSFQPKADYLKVSKFIEKPNLTDIKKLSKTSGLYWNSGIYTLSIKTLITEVEKYQPQYSLHLIESNPQLAYKKCPNFSVDIGISQKSNKLVLIPAKFIWSDIGQWQTIYQFSKKDKYGLAKLNQNTNFLSINSRNCLIHSDKNKLIGLIGVRDLAIIDTPTGLLVCHLDQSSEVRDLVGKIVKKPSTVKYFLDTNDLQAKS